MIQFMKTKLLTLMAVLAALPAAQASLSWSWSGSSTIPDNSPSSGAAAGIYIPSTDSQLSGIANPYVTGIASVGMTISGGWAGDYTVVLQHVNATGGGSQSLTLFSLLLGGAAANGGIGGTGANAFQLTSTGGTVDSTFGASSSSIANITGTYNLNFGTTFNNIAPTGDWILYVTDSQAGSQGILTGWTLGLDVVPEPVNVALGIFGGLLGGIALVRHLGAKRWLVRRRPAEPVV
jgi:hypothetical protein